MSFLSTEMQQRTSQARKQSQILKILRILHWEKIEKVLFPLKKEKKVDLGGQRQYCVLKMFKAMLLGQWFSLSDENLEDSIRYRMDFMLFTDFDEDVPDSTTLCRFRNHLTKEKLWDILLSEINRQLEDKKLKVKNCDGAIVDATLISSASRPQKVIEKKNNNKNDGEGNVEFKCSSSKDPDASWVKKGARFHYGYKGFVRTDKKGFIEKAFVTSAHESEMNKLPSLMDKEKKRKVYADKGYCSQKNRDFLKKTGLNDGIMHKATRSKKLNEREKENNKNISKIRYIVEQTFGTLKRRFHFWRSSYMGCEKTEAQFIAKSICLNLLKAANCVCLTNF